MNRDKEIYGIASIYIREHGEDAVIHAAMRADALLDAGDLDGQRVWLRVIEASMMPHAPIKLGIGGKRLTYRRTNETSNA